MGRPLSSIDVLRTAIQLTARIFPIRPSAVRLAVGGLFLVLQAVRDLPAEAQTPQAEQWAWMGGSSTVPAWGSAPAVYGTRGVLSADNVPGGRSGQTSWIDHDGNAWIFGGSGVDQSGVGGLLNDLWKFNPTTREWAWMSGSSTVTCDSSTDYCGMPGVYGILGKPAPSNVPPGRYGASSWIDDQGDLWLFGGTAMRSSTTSYGSFYALYPGLFNDLWKFDPAVGEWTWMGGSSAPGARGVYGALGTPAAGNIPGARESAVSWTDGDGDVWLFGGNGYDSAGLVADLNDLWKYSPSNGEWAWISGSSTITHSVVWSTGGEWGMPGVSPGLRVFDEANVPGGRHAAAGWIDGQGNLWLWSGGGFDLSGNFGELNDLWEFNTRSFQWAWMGGTGALTMVQTGFSPGRLAWAAVCEPNVHGPKDAFSPANVPGCREYATSWSSNGVLWMFGGVSDGPRGGTDLWRFNPSTFEWAWMGGSAEGGYSILGVYGNLSIPDAANHPGARSLTTGWTEISGCLEDMALIPTAISGT